MRVATTYQEYVSLHHFTTRLCQFVCRNKTQTTYQEYVSLHHYTTLLCQFVCRNKTQTMAQSRGFPKMIGQNRKLSVNPNMKLMTKSMPRISFVKGKGECARIRELHGSMLYVENILFPQLVDGIIFANTMACK